MPERFLIAEDHDKDKALERWRVTLLWRQEENVDTILEEIPHVKYNIVRKYYPQSFYCRDRKGNMVYIEKPGEWHRPKQTLPPLQLTIFARLLLRSAPRWS